MNPTTLGWKKLSVPLVEIRWDLPDQCSGFYETVEKPAGWGTSYQWLCVKCGKEYARAQIVSGNIPYTWDFLRGVCPTCPGNRYAIPGSLESIAFIRWEVPSLIMRYQLDKELNFLNNNNHPHNQESS